MKNQKYLYKKCANSDFDIDIMFLTYNHEEYVEQALNSILMQKTKYKYRIIVGEDASTDNTRKIILKYYHQYPDRFTLILWNENVGVEKNVHRLVTMCKARYIMTLEGDDYWTDPLKLEKQISFLEQHNEFIGIAHNVRCVDVSGKLLHKDYHAYPIQEDHVYGKIQALNYELVSHTSSIIYRNFWRDWGRKDYMAYHQCHANGDLKVSIYLGLIGKIFYSREIMADHRRIFSGSSWTAQHYNRNILGFLNRNHIEIKQCMEKLLGETCDFAKTNKYIQEEALIKLFTEFNKENLSVYYKIVKDNLKVKKN